MSCFQCKRCGGCCANFLPLSESEVKDLRLIVKKRNLKPYKRLFEVNSIISCPFLDNSNNCTIYEERPLICRIYDCGKMENKDFSDGDELLKEKRRIVDLRKEVFYE